MNIFKKVKVVIFSRISQFKVERKYQRQAKNTKRLRAEKATDYKRWARSEELFEDWNDRTAILASLIDPGSRIIEFGAGAMALKKYLPDGCQYTPTDIHKRSSNTLICDLNKELNIDLLPYNTGVFSGVLEYVYDIDKVFSQISEHIEYVIMSYACRDISSVNRIRRGWLSDYSKEDINAVIIKYGYKIIFYDEWRTQSLYKLRKVRE